MSRHFVHRGNLWLLLFAITAVRCKEDLLSSSELVSMPKIVGGQEVGITQHPYIVSVRRKTCVKCAYEHHCGGTIFSEDIIITAASCLLDAETRDLHVVAGSSLRTGSLQDGGMIFPVSKIIIHQNSNIDLALLRLALKIPLQNILTTGVVTLATTTPKAGTPATIVGWGQIAENGSYSERLREAVVPIVAQADCISLYELNESEDYEICAGLPNGGVDACYGDAGGPLLVNGHLVGVTTWDYGCARPGSSGVYTNVIQLNEWIVSHALGVHMAFL